MTRMSPKKATQRTAIAYCLHDDTDYLQSSLDSLAVGSDGSRTDAFAFISRLPWHAAPGDWQAAAATAEALGLTVVPGDWPTEQARRQAVLEHLLAPPPFAAAGCSDFGARRIGITR